MKWGKCENKKCGKKRKLHRNGKTGKLLCVPCIDIGGRQKGTCQNTACGKEGVIVRKNRRTGQLLCNTCRLTPKQCSLCGKLRPPAKYEEEKNQPICKTCYYSDPSTFKDCYKCGDFKPVHAYTRLGPICPGCYRRRWRKKQKALIPG